MEHIPNIHSQKTPCSQLPHKTKKFILQVTGTLLYYALAIDNEMLTALSAIAAEQATPVQGMLQTTKQLLNFAATQGNTIITYNARDIVLAIHSDASYLSMPKARRQAVGHFFCELADTLKGICNHLYVGIHTYWHQESRYF